MGKKFDPSTQLPDMSGKVIIVTGGNKGLGLGTVKLLVHTGAKVYMAARTEAAATDAIKAIEAENPSGSVHFFKLDLSDPIKTQAAAEDFMSKESRLDILINNAGLMYGPYTRGVHDMSVIMMINHIGPFVFTESLLPLMQKTSMEPGSDVRVVMVASASHTTVPSNISFKTADEFNEQFKGATMSWFKRYGMSKLCNILYTGELQRRLAATGSNILVLATYPGAVYSFADRLPLILRIILAPILKGCFKSTLVGGETQVFAAASPEIRADSEKWKGQFVSSCGPSGKFNLKIEHTTEQARDQELSKNLWDTTEEFLERIGLHTPEPEKNIQIP